MRRSTRKSAGRTPAKFRPDEAEEEAPLGLPVKPSPAATEPDADDSEDDEDFEENDEIMPNMHFGLASRAALEAEEGGAVAPPLNIFLINAIIEGLAGCTAVYESFLPEGDRLLVADASSPMVRARPCASRPRRCSARSHFACTRAAPPQMLRMWGGAIVGLAATSYLMSLEDSSRARSAFCLGTCVYHAAAASIILHLFFTAEDTALPGGGLVQALVSKLALSVDEVAQRKACAAAAALVHGYLGLGLYKSSQETTDEVRGACGGRGVLVCLAGTGVQFGADRAVCCRNRSW